MKIDVIGTGNAFSRYKNTSSIRVIDESNYQWLIDCGATVPRAVWQRELAQDEIDALYFTHIHPDHCLGLTTLLNQWHSEGRQKPLQIWCQPEHREWLETLSRLAFWPEPALNYPLSWHTVEDRFSWRNWQIETAFSQHAISNRSVRITADGHALFYSGDGRPTEATVSLMEGADLVFQECGSLMALPTTSSHGDLPDSLALRQRADFGELYLYHCEDRDRAAIAAEIQSYSDVRLAEDGELIDLSHADIGDTRVLSSS